jgi:hypothetical protein
MFSIWGSSQYCSCGIVRQPAGECKACESDQLFGGPIPSRLDVEPIQLLKIDISVSEAGKVHNSCHRAPGGSWVAGIPTR